jgi:H+/Cl- antiporter ClcA
MTHSHDLSIPLMAAAFLASGTSKLINPQPLYRALCNAYQVHNNNAQLDGSHYIGS